MPITSPPTFSHCSYSLFLRPIVKPATSRHFLFFSPANVTELYLLFPNREISHTIPHRGFSSLPAYKSKNFPAIARQHGLICTLFVLLISWIETLQPSCGALSVSLPNFLYKYTRIPCICQINYCTKERSLLYYIKNFQITTSNRRVKHNQ